jgi:uncharacterized Tic20 family protein
VTVPPPHPSDAYGPYPHPYPATQPPYNRAAVTALVFAILSLLLAPASFLLGPGAVIASRRARREIARTGERGDTMALVSLVIGWIGTVFVILVLVVLLIAGLSAALDHPTG